MLAEDPWEWRAVWMSGLAALDAGDFAAAQSVVQRGLRPGARASWRPSWRWRWPASGAASSTSPRGSTGPARAPTPTTSPPAAFGLARIRARPRGRGRRGRRARPGALDQPQLHRGPPAARGRAVRVRRRAARVLVRRRWPACRASASTRASAAELTAKILERALARRAARAGPKHRGHRSARTPPGTSRCATGWRRPTGSWPAAETDDGARYALVDKANAVRRWTLR